MSSKDSRSSDKSRSRESRQDHHRNYAPQYQYKQSSTPQYQYKQSDGRRHGTTGGGGGGQQVSTGSTYHQAVDSGYKSGHMEINSLYSGDSGQLTVNSMNAPNNSTLQCGCENIDCPFCNQMLSIQMSGGQ